MARPSPTDRLDLIEALLQQVLAPLTRPSPLRHRGRPHVLEAGLLWAGLLVCVVRGVPRRREIWRVLSEAGLWDYDRVPIEPEAVRIRLKRAGSAPVQALFTQITAELAGRTRGQPHLAPFASAVYAIDDTTLDQVRRLLPDPESGQQAVHRVLPGKLTCVFDLRHQLFRHILPSEQPHQNPKQPMAHVRTLLPPGSLVLLDLGYFSFQLFDELTDDGLWFVTRMRAGTTTEEDHVLCQQAGLRDSLVWLGVHRANQARHRMRRIAVTIGGKERVYLTNVLDPVQLSVAEVVELYARRWDIELAFKTLKRELGLRILWSGDWEQILQQVWATLIVAQVAQAIRLQIAERAGVDLFDVSLALLLRTLPQIVRRGEDDVIGIIAGFKPTRGGIIRPSTRAKPLVPAIRTIDPPPPELAVVRAGRYAGRRCGPGGTNRPPVRVSAHGGQS
jgi:DDE family transposase